MKNDKEFFGTLTGFTDDASSLALVMQDVKEYKFEGSGKDRTLVGKMPSILLNGTHICTMIPGDDEPKPKAVNE